MRKKLINFVFVGLAIAGLATVTSCKKGENDPFLSLKSRKARITGEWKLTEATLTNTNNLNGTSTTSTTLYTSSTCTSNGNTIPYSETFTIEKDGTYKIEIVEDGLAHTLRGNWVFAGKIKDIDLKNKEAIMLVQQEYSAQGFNYMFNGFEEGRVLIIDQLKNKEMIFKGEFVFTPNFGGPSSSSTYDKTYEKK